VDHAHVFQTHYKREKTMNRKSTYLFTALAISVLSGCATQSSNDSGDAASGTPGAQTSSAQTRPAPAPAPSSTLSASRAAGKAPSARSIYYEFDRSELKTDDRRLVEQYARYLRENPDAKVRIEGNADERGSSEYNLALGQRRAESVMNALRAGGLKEERLEAVSYGKEKPRAQGHDEKSWAENRRSDINYR